MFLMSRLIILRFHYSDIQLAICINKKRQQSQENQDVMEMEDSISSYTEVSCCETFLLCSHIQYV